MWNVVEPYVPLVLQGTYLTILVALLSMAGALLIGLFGALGSISGGALTKRAVDLYTTVIRGVPDLVLMLLLYYGGQMLINRLGDVTGLWDYIEISAFMAGTITIAIIFGAYMVETFRGAARIDAARNMARYYRLAIEPTLFGNIALVRNWGRIGTRGQERVEFFDTKMKALSLFLEILREKRRKGYRSAPRGAGSLLL
jgi:His/Glu/Gln/Arg/opine family amino acid ABC transporter permease subunit